jgi:outer membrane protein assembly factor BamA
VRRKRDEVYDESKVDETRRALIETGLFSTVHITPSADPQKPGEARMTIDATERLPGHRGIGLGYRWPPPPPP